MKACAGLQSIRSSEPVLRCNMSLCSERQFRTQDRLAGCLPKAVSCEGNPAARPKRLDSGASPETVKQLISASEVSVSSRLQKTKSDFKGCSGSPSLDQQAPLTLARSEPAACSQQGLCVAHSEQDSATKEVRSCRKASHLLRIPVVGTCTADWRLTRRL